ncbi:uncharacterized protein LOC114302671 [Camellia sinensis]|uniref:uncharacterized protein LOC114302671 n=1 Tax=Camellia sinensis TaxID=4442 RepID=UPI001036374A|nr:uncharacterized protein LOC114302671 [Camellia sinensis]
MSDHSPLLLMEDERDRGPRPFRYINAWTLHPKFLPFVEKWWREHQVEGWAGFRLFQKLKELKITLKQWNSEVFGNINTKLKKVDDELHMFDLLAEERELEEAEKPRRREARVEAYSLTRMVEWLWLQKSRLNWNFNEFSEAEVWGAVKGCDENRAPGPDGLNLACFQKLWKVMKSDVLNFLSEFHKNCKLVKGINSSFITLVPKKENPVGLADYRPITFIGERNILDGVLVANEVVDSWKKSRKKGLIIKLDFEKAYDSLNWEFLLSMMVNFGFGGKWVEWIAVCVTSAKLSVLVNGSPTKEFSPQRGLSQGDSLSPFLFIIAAKCFSILMSRALDLGLIKGVKIGSNGLVLTYLQFVDDSLLLCEADALEYLGLPLGANPSRKATWRPVFDKFRSKLAGWKRKLLSFAGRLTLIKYVLSSLPLYYLSMFKLPQGVTRDLDKLQASFLWSESELKKMVHLVKWKEVAKPVDQGGMGVRRVKEVNKCLMLKWW